MWDWLVDLLFNFLLRLSYFQWFLRHYRLPEKTSDILVYCVLRCWLDIYLYRFSFASACQIILCIFFMISFFLVWNFTCFNDITLVVILAFMGFVANWNMHQLRFLRMLVLCHTWSKLAAAFNIQRWIDWRALHRQRIITCFFAGKALQHAGHHLVCCLTATPERKRCSVESVDSSSCIYCLRLARLLARSGIFAHLGKSVAPYHSRSRSHEEEPGLRTGGWSSTTPPSVPFVILALSGISLVLPWNVHVIRISAGLFWLYGLILRDFTGVCNFCIIDGWLFIYRRHCGLFWRSKSSISPAHWAGLIWLKILKARRISCIWRISDWNNGLQCWKLQDGDWLTASFSLSLFSGVKVCFCVYIIVFM